MITIRKNTFETNSSSTHSLALLCGEDSSEVSYLIEEDGCLRIEFRNFDGRLEIINSIRDKIAFLLQLSNEGGYDWNSFSNIDDYEDDVYSSDMFKRIEKVLSKYIEGFKYILIENFAGSIDHQTREQYYSGEDYLYSNNVDLKDYLLKNYIIIADHD